MKHAIASLLATAALAMSGASAMPNTSAPDRAPPPRAQRGLCEGVVFDGSRWVRPARARRKGPGWSQAQAQVQRMARKRRGQQLHRARCKGRRA